MLRDDGAVSESIMDEAHHIARRRAIRFFVRAFDERRLAALASRHFYHHPPIDWTLVGRAFAIRSRPDVNVLLRSNNSTVGLALSGYIVFSDDGHTVYMLCHDAL